MVRKVEVSPETAEFYERVEKLLKVAGKYAGAVKLERNLCDPEEAFKVRHVLNKYYGGDMCQLADSIRWRKQHLLEIIDDISQKCLRAGVTPVRKPEELIKLLKDKNRRDAWREYMKRHLRTNTIVSLQDLEREYRNPF